MLSTDGDAEDPFACFGDDDDAENDAEVDTKVVDVPTTSDNQRTADPRAQTVEKRLRDPNCGVLAFHPGTEQSLLRHVQLELTSDRLSSSSPPNTKASIPGELEVSPSIASLVLKLVDDFCLSRHWMMHVGEEKGVVVQEFVTECHIRFQETNKSLHPLVLVELGTYCGYSSILLAHTLKELGCSLFHIFSVEVVPENAKVANELIRLAQLEDRITVLLLDIHDEESSLTKLLQQTIKTIFPSHYSEDIIPRIDFLFVDHDKSMYLSDLRLLEEAKMIQRGSFVAADNVVFAAIDDYRQYIAELRKKGVVQSQLKEGFLEYCEPDCIQDVSQKAQLRDGIGKGETNGCC